MENPPPIKTTNQTGRLNDGPQHTDVQRFSVVITSFGIERPAKRLVVSKLMGPNGGVPSKPKIKQMSYTRIARFDAILSRLSTMLMLDQIREGRWSPLPAISLPVGALATDLDGRGAASFERV